MEISILEKKQNIIKKIIESDNIDLINLLETTLNHPEYDIPIEVQNRVMATRERGLANPQTLVSEEDIFYYLDEK